MSDDDAGTMGILRRHVSPRPMPVWLLTLVLLAASMVWILVMASVAVTTVLVDDMQRTRGWDAVAGPLTGGAAIMVGGIASVCALAWGSTAWLRQKGAELANCPDGERGIVARRAMRTAGLALLLFGSLLQIAPTLMP